MNTILTTRPAFETATRWGYWWVENKLEPQVRESGYNVVALAKTSAVRDKLLNSLQEDQPCHLYLFGHGNTTVITGHNYNRLIWFGDNTILPLIQGKSIHALSCLTAQNLGPWLVENGLAFYMGYAREFIFCYQPSNYPNSLAKYFFLADMQFTITLSHGETADVARNVQQRLYDQFIAEAPEICKAYLLWDKNSARYIGKPDYRLPEPKPAEWPFYRLNAELFADIMGKRVRIGVIKGRLDPEQTFLKVI